MELNENKVIFTPALDFSDPSSFLNLVEDILADISHQGTLVKRIRPGEDADYFVSYNLPLTQLLQVNSKL